MSYVITAFGKVRGNHDGFYLILAVGRGELQVKPRRSITISVSPQFETSQRENKETLRRIAPSGSRTRGREGGERQTQTQTQTQIQIYPIYMADRAPHDRDRRVYVVLHQDGATVTILGVYEELHDANRDCLLQAAQAGIDLLQDSPTSGPDKHHFQPVEPSRWDTPDGVSCWVESHMVVPSRVAASNLATR